MKYITILERYNSECPNIGTIAANSNLEESFKEAVESHFDAEMAGYYFLNKEIKALKDCINAYPIDVMVKLKPLDVETSEYKVELSETWLYQ